MGIFSSIKNAIFGSDEDEKAPAKPVPTPAPASATAPAATPQAAAVRTSEVSTVDVENRLDSMPGADRLNWRTSIVDLMKLINVDSDYESRKALAQELGRPEYEGNAQDNLWLHRKTMQELARNGGKVPAEFLD
ncbi:DUF3597 domain-containing protein [Qipengyuania sp. JC766]|uniref:DUF3597 domain-containing protein n=1 Tax=Qipengyuania sp. JC766 TaxID=3232139 RepID=UPI0034590311